VKKIDVLKETIRSGLCNRCGSCVGLSEGKIVFNDREGAYLPDIIEEVDEKTAELINEVCSGRKFDFPVNRDRIFGADVLSHEYIGAYKDFSIGYATEEEIRRLAASGGILTTILLFLLRSGEIDGAVVTRMSKTKPWLTEPVIAKTEEEIIAAAQSKYIITSVNEIIPEISSFAGNLAYVGLPGQVQSIRSLQRLDHPAVRKIKYFFGPFYGNTLHFSSIVSFLRSHGIKDYTQIAKLYFRYGEWPGNMRVELKDGQIFQMKKFYANYLILFHIVKNSLLCTDLTNEFTDISVGDAWAPVYEERGKGFSLIITRSDAGKRIIDKMKQDNLIETFPIDLDQAIEMHSHGYDLKKRGSFIRLKFLRFLGRPVPDYGYRIDNFKMTRYLMEFMIDMLFLLCSTRFARFVIDQIPPAFMGKVFENARKRWKKGTRKIKTYKL